MTEEPTLGRDAMELTPEERRVIERMRATANPEYNRGFRDGRAWGITLGLFAAMAAVVVGVVLAYMLLQLGKWYYGLRP